MNTIILNTQTGAVSEYTNYAFQSITPTHAGNASGLFAFGGDLDIAQPIVGQFQTATKLRSTTLKKMLEMVYLSMKAEGDAYLTVFGEYDSWTYCFPVRDSGQSRCVVGRGIRENYLGLGFAKSDGAYFTIDRIEPLMHESKTRRV